MLQQKARLNWSIQGDKNTKFFHQSIQRRRNKNNISRILWQGTWFSQPCDIKKVFYNHFKGFLSSKRHKITFNVGNLIQSRLNSSDRSLLEQAFTMEEVDLALSDSTNDKSPGPDGINFRCLKIMWPSLKQKILDCFNQFAENLHLPNGLNSFFIALIPKTFDPKEVQDFRPMSLINSISKLFTKCLTNRLGLLMEKLVSGSQTGYLKGRQASESILIVKEACNAVKKSRTSGFILKLDFEKAFDTINWEFL